MKFNKLVTLTIALFAGTYVLSTNVVAGKLTAAEAAKYRAEYAEERDEDLETRKEIENKLAKYKGMSPDELKKHESKLESFQEEIAGELEEAKEELDGGVLSIKYSNMWREVDEEHSRHYEKYKKTVNDLIQKASVAQPAKKGAAVKKP